MATDEQFDGAHFVMLWDFMLDSSINEHKAHVKWVWVSLLLTCNAKGYLRKTIPAIARTANVPLAEAAEAVKILSSPDKLSTSKEADGRRIIQEGPNVYRIVNYQQYRQLASELRRREQARVRQARKRGRDGGVSERDTSQGERDDSEQPRDSYTSTSTSTSPSPSSIVLDEDDDAQTGPTEQDVIDAVLEFWKDHDLRPRVTALSSARRSSILARFREYDLEMVMRALANRAASTFLCHEIFDGRGASIDWVFGPKNFVKVLDNFDDTDIAARKKEREEEKENLGPWYPEVHFWEHPWHPEDDGDNLVRCGTDEEIVAKYQSEMIDQDEGGEKRWKRFADWMRAGQ